MKPIPEWLKDWMEFQDDSEETSQIKSQVLNQTFLKSVSKDINPSGLQVLTKLTAIHGITSLISLMICPQLGVGGWLSGDALMNVFMRFGHSVCFFLCGGLFILGTLLMARFFMEVEEQRKVFKNRYLAIPGLLIFSFAVLKMFASDGGHHSMEDASIYWLLGASIVGIAGSMILRRPAQIK